MEFGRETNTDTRRGQGNHRTRTNDPPEHYRLYSGSSGFHCRVQNIIWSLHQNLTGLKVHLSAEGGMDPVPVQPIPEPEPEPEPRRGLESDGHAVVIVHFI